MPENRIKQATLPDILRISTKRECSQREALPLVLWSLIVDELIGGLNENSYFVVGYEDDITILLCGKYPSIIPELF
jgi:hypothetical protein